MDPDLGMAGACIPWQNKHDVEPLLVNADFDFILEGAIPGIRIHREAGNGAPFDIFFCKTKYHAYRILMGLDPETVEQRMAERSRRDSEFLRAEKARLAPFAPPTERRRCPAHGRARALR